MLKIFIIDIFSVKEVAIFSLREHEENSRKQ